MPASRIVFSPLRDFGFYVSAEFLGRVADRFEALVCEPRAQRRSGENLHDLRMQARDHSARRVRGREVLEQADVDRIGRDIAHQDGVAVGRGVRRELGADVAARPHVRILPDPERTPSDAVLMG